MSNYGRHDQRQDQRYDEPGSHRQKRRRSQRSGRQSFRHFSERKRHGWGMGLYRNRREGKICGVAAGLADHWDVADWVVRLLFIVLFLFTGMLAVWAYIGGAVLLSPRPEDRSHRRGRRAEASFSAEYDEPANEEAFGPEMEYDERYHDYRPKKMFRYSESASVRLARARERLDAAVRRVEDMESYVTSRRFRLNKEFSKL
ncbi:MAG: envelope stress response membrane protein PspC [Congregibacter sp.]